MHLFPTPEGHRAHDRRWQSKESLVQVLQRDMQELIIELTREEARPQREQSGAADRILKQATYKGYSNSCFRADEISVYCIRQSANRVESRPLARGTDEAVRRCAEPPRAPPPFAGSARSSRRRQSPRCTPCKPSSAAAASAPREAHTPMNRNELQFVCMHITEYEYN